MPIKPEKPLKLRHIEKRLDDMFGGKIYLDDWRRRGDVEQRAAFLGRALAAYALVCLDAADPTAALKAVVDGGGDEGMDAIHVDPQSSIVYLIQSKWCAGGNRSVPSSEVATFLAGVDKILSQDWDGFNDRILAKRSELDAAVLDPKTQFKIILVSPTNQILAAHGQKIVDRKLRSINGTGGDPLASFEALDVNRIHRSLTQSLEKSNIDIKITLLQWGQVDSPYWAYYGQVDVAEVLGWSKFGTALFSKDLRSFMGPKTDVYASVSDTLTNQPQHLWYFNNGITILCNGFKKLPIHGDKHERGVFDCRSVSVVNGAQTIGSIWDVLQGGELLDPVARVPLRIISLEKCPEGFATDVTRAANTQNRIERRDFVALDPCQTRLVAEMRLEGRTYVIRPGDSIPSGAEGCDFQEAATALACSYSLEYSVQAKREVGRLWSDVKREPYSLLFNSVLTAERLWRAVRILRAAEETLKQNVGNIERGPLIAAHGNCFIIYRVFRSAELARWEDLGAPIDSLTESAARVARREVESTCHFFQTKNEYPQTVFKNLGRCRELDKVLSKNGTPKSHARPPAGLLFEK